jgi:tRNA uridine 5-carboxymethylaminomethyl modification enzyme
VAEILRQPGVRLGELIDRGDVTLDLGADSRDLDLSSLETAVKYEGYLKQEASRAAKAGRQERRRIPSGFPFARVPGLSREAVQRLTQVRPETLGQASRIPGITPAAVAVLGAYLGRLSPEIGCEGAM